MLNTHYVKWHASCIGKIHANYVIVTKCNNVRLGIALRGYVRILNSTLATTLAQQLKVQAYANH